MVGDGGKWWEMVGDVRCVDMQVDTSRCKYTTRQIHKTTQV